MAKIGSEGEIPVPQDASNPEQREPKLDDIFIDPKYINEFSNLSKTDLQTCRALTKSDEAFTFTAGYKNRREAIRKQHGERAIQSQPLVSLLSARVLESADKSLELYGTINAEYLDQTSGKTVVHEIYKSDAEDAQFVGLKQGNSSFPDNKMGDLIFDGQTCMPLLPNKSIKVLPKLFQKSKGDVFADTSLELDVETEDDKYGGIKNASITCSEGFEAEIWYMIVPFGVTCCVDISVYYRHSTVDGGDDSFTVSGSIAAEYGYKYDEYYGMKYILFDKHGEESERVYNKGGSLKLSRCWLAVPAYSSIVVDMKLSIAGANFKSEVKLFPEQDGWSDETDVLDDYIITAYARWFSPDHHWQSITGDDADNQSQEESNNDVYDVDDEVGDDDVDVYDNEASSSTIPNVYEPLPYLALEIYSVFIGAEDPAASLLGTIKVMSKDALICSIYKSSEKWWSLSKLSPVKPVSDGFHVIYKYRPLELKVDITDNNMRSEPLVVKGYSNWETTHFLDTDSGYGKQLCSVIRGRRGFAAVHYSIFSTGLVATIKATLNSKPGSDAVDISSMVCGSIIAQYSHLEYPSKYSKKCFRFELWRGSGPVWSKTEGTDRRFPLSQSRIFVPSNSSLLIEVGLLLGKNIDYSLTPPVKMKEIAVGKAYEDSDSLNSDYSLCIKVDWKQMEKDE